MGDRGVGPFLGAALLSNVGNWFHVVASVIVVFDLTGSAFMVGLISFANFAAFLFLSPLAGAVTDRLPRRHVLVAAQSGSAVAAGALALTFLTGNGSAGAILMASLVLGIGSVFSIPATLAVLPELVPAADHGAGITLNTMGINVARLVGPVLGALVLEQAGAGAAFGGNALTFLVFALVSRRLPVPVREPDRPGHDGRYRVAWRAVCSDRRLSAAFGCVVVIGVLLEPNTTLAPSLAVQVGADGGFVGWIVGAFGAGALLGGSLTRKVSVLALPVVQLGFALAASGMLLIAAASAPALLLAGFAMLGAGYLTAVSALTTQIQQAVPLELRGRTMALWSQLLLGVRPVSSVAIGAATDLSSARLSSAALCVVALVGLALARIAVPASPD